MTLTSTPGNTPPIETLSVCAPADCAPAHPMGDDEIRQHIQDCVAAEASGGCFWTEMASIHAGRMNG